MANANLTLTSQAMGEGSSYISTVDVNQEISIFWNKALMLNLIRMENFDLALKFYDIQSLEFITSFLIKTSSFKNSLKEVSPLKYSLDFKRGFIYIYN